MVATASASEDFNALASQEPGELLQQLEADHLAPGGFHHAQHVAVAWALLERESLDSALPQFSGLLKRFATRAGVPDLYHETITWLFLILIHERRLTLGRHDWETFVAASPDLLSDHRALLDAYYSDGRLQSELARRAFLLPDKVPQPSARPATT